MTAAVFSSKNSWILFCLLFLGACARVEIQKAEEAMRPTNSVPVLHEISPIGELQASLEKQIEFLHKDKRFGHFRFGSRVVEKSDYLHSLEYMVELIQNNSDFSDLWKKIGAAFDFYEVYGKEDWSDVFITSYFEPVIYGRQKPEGRFTQAVYRLPEDLVEVKLRQFGDEFQSFPQVLRGRLVPETDTDIASVIPYFSRTEIDTEGALKGKKLELFYVDPVDSFFMQVQGSGVVEFPNGEQIRIGYAGQNGHAYEAVGKFLKHAIPVDKMSLDSIESYLRSLPRAEMQNYLNMNPSYIFFKPTKTNAVTYLGTSATGLRTIATDAKFFPKGALVLLQFQKPVFKETQGHDVSSWENVSQLMIDQDVGGAIRGPGRVDLFWGRGAEAKRSAGVIKQKGKLYYLAPKEDLIKQLREKS